MTVAMRAVRQADGRSAPASAFLAQLDREKEPDLAGTPEGVRHRREVVPLTVSLRVRDYDRANDPRDRREHGHRAMAMIRIAGCRTLRTAVANQRSRDHSGTGTGMTLERNRIGRWEHRAHSRNLHTRMLDDLAPYRTDSSKVRARNDIRTGRYADAMCVRYAHSSGGRRNKGPNGRRKSAICDRCRKLAPIRDKQRQAFRMQS